MPPQKPWKAHRGAENFMSSLWALSADICHYKSKTNGNMWQLLLNFRPIQFMRAQPCTTSWDVWDTARSLQERKHLSNLSELKTPHPLPSSRSDILLRKHFVMLTFPRSMYYTIFVNWFDFKSLILLFV